MILARTFTVLAVGTMLGVAALPAGADQQRRARGDQGSRGGQRAARPANPDSGRGEARRGDGQARRAVPRAAVPPGSRATRPPSRGPGPVGVPGRVWRQRGPYPGPVFHGSRGWYPYRSYGPRIRYAVPYYSFRPRLSIGLGLWAGFPVPYPALGYAAPYGYPPAYRYPAPYPYPVPYPVPYGSSYPAQGYPSQGYPAQAPAGSVAVDPGTYGGVSFQITPDDAEVWVDGGYAGRANEFGPNVQPLTLTPGMHRVELRAPGFLLLSFDVTITPGQVLPYQGALQPGP